MASIIRIKRSTGTVAPASLYYGELGLTIGIGSHGNSGGRLFVGDNSASPDVADTDPVVIGGKYYTSMMGHSPGAISGVTNNLNSDRGVVAILSPETNSGLGDAESLKVNQWNVDNLRLDGNKISSTDTNGNIELDPVGTGVLKFIGGASQTFDITDGSTTRFSVNSVNGSVTITQGTITTDNPILSATSTWNDGGVTFNGIKLNITNTASAAASKLIDLQIGSTTQFSVTKTGNTQIFGDLNIDGGDLTTTAATFNLLNATATTVNAFGAATAIGIGSITGTATINNPTVVGTQTTQNLYNTTATTVNAFGAATTIGIGSITGTATINNPTVVGTQATQDLYNTVATNLNFAGAATALVIGATSGVTTIRNTTVDLDGDLNVDGGDITTNLTAFNLLNATATNVNAFGAATALVVGATTGIATINNPTVVGTQATQNLYNTVATNLNFAGAATALDIGATTGIATIRNATLSVPNATILNLGATSSVTSVNFQSTPNTSFVSIAATTNATTTTSGALRVAGGVGIEKDVHIGGTLTVSGTQTFDDNLTVTGNLQVNGNTTLGNQSTDTITITGVLGHTGPLTNTGGVTIDNIGISSNVISTKSGGGNVIYIDPYPDGLSNQGLVVIKGDLQVDGTTTTVDSSSVTVNGAIISLGDVTSNRTVVSAVASGVSTISLDSVVGINTGDIISGSASLPNSGVTTITAYNSSTKIVTIEGSTSSGITSTTQLIITHAFDTNTDRGISFKYNTSVGTANNKIGFFGYDDSTGHFTYVPDATISNSVVSGVKGTLDVGALLLNFATSGINTRGSAFFDADGKLISTNTPEVGTATTSNLILTTNASNVPVWTSTLDGGTF